MGADYEAEAWVLRAGGHPDATPGEALVRTRIRLPGLEVGEALVEPVIGAWEANLTHAITRSPIDICRARGEDQVVLGNLGIVRVLEVRPGPGDEPLEAGTLCLVLPFGVVDRHGYAELIHAYDCPGTYGLLARLSKTRVRNLLPMIDSRLSHEQWASYGRYFTAWDNWNQAFACWRTQIPDDPPGDHLVMAWGGGVSVAELTLARRAGFRVAMTAGSDERLAFLEAQGILAIDRRRFPGLSHSRVGSDPALRRRHNESLAAFGALVDDLTDGEGAAIVVDNIGETLLDATLRVLAREGVVSTCGWKAGMRIPLLRGAEAIARHIHVHTHAWRLQDSPQIRDVIEAGGWIAPEGASVCYGFDDIPDLARAYAAGEIDSYFPLFVNEAGAGLATAT